MCKLQKVQNKLLRSIENVRLKDKISTKTMLKNQGMLAVNQIAAQIKLTKIWKATRNDCSPIKIKKLESRPNGRITRGVTQGKLEEPGTSYRSTNSFIGDATRLWNVAPIEIKSAKTLYSAKLEIKKYVKTLPI